MAKKKRNSNNLGFNKLEKDLGNDVKYLEKLIIERRRFFIKLGLLIIFILLLLLIASIL